MTKFEYITKDTESLAKFFTLVQGPSCDGCFVQEECEKLREAGETYRICVRSWCAWLNKEE